MKKLLLATDLSPRSDRAAHRALSIANARGAELIVLHVIDEDLPAETRNRLSQAAEEQFQNAMIRIPQASSVATTVRVVFGHNFRAIIAEANINNVELIITGIHRDVGSGRRASDTTMGKIARYSSCSVLVVSQPVDKPYEKAIVGVDFSHPSKMAIKEARRFLPEGSLFFVHAFEVPFAGFMPGKETREQVRRDHEQRLHELLRSEMAEFLKSASDASPRGKYEEIVRHGGPNQVLREEVDRIRPGLLVVGIHGRVGISRAFFGSLAESLLSDPPCDVMAVSSW